MSPVRWGVLSTGNIAREMVEAARRSGAARFVAVASRGGDRARRFADEFDLELAFASYQALLECDGVTPFTLRCRSRCTSSGRSRR